MAAKILEALLQALRGADHSVLALFWFTCFVGGYMLLAGMLEGLAWIVRAIWKWRGK